MAESRKQVSGGLAPAPAALGDALVDFHYVASEMFLPTRGRALGITRNGLALMIQRGDFPRPIRLSDGPKAEMRWRVSDLRKWIAGRAAAAA
jgi:predicted DNA-binding transcriptional regulator AlpA